MRIALKLLVVTALSMATFQRVGAAEDKAFKDEREKASYAVGVYFGNSLKRGSMDVDLDVVRAAMADALQGKELRLTDMQVSETLKAYQQESKRKVAEANKKAGDAFFAENRTKPGIKTKAVTMPDGKSAELQYKVITEGTGEIPKSNDTVSVNYKGTLLNGKEFDSSYKRGQPAKFMVTRVIRGWTMALEMMKVGSKWEVYIPAALAYGDNPNPNSGIEPGSTLTFEVELLGIEPPVAAAPPGTQPLTSDIIKVPSADELKKGAKIEVIKAEDAAKMAQTNSDKAKAPDKK